MEQSKKKECTVTFEPSGLKIQVPAGTTLLDAAHKAGIYLSSICGGDGYCGKCKLIIDRAENFECHPTPLLTAEQAGQNVVLACRTKVLRDATVTVPKSHTLQASQILMDADTRRFGELSGDVPAGTFQFDPLVRKIYVEMPPPTVEDHTADHERLYLAIRGQIDAAIMQTGLPILQKLSGLLQSCGYKATATIGRRGQTTEIIDLEAKRNIEITIVGDSKLKPNESKIVYDHKKGGC